MATRRAADLAAAQDEDAKRNLTSWRTLNVHTLRLKCNQYDQSEVGTKDELIRTLMTHFATLRDQESSSSSQDSSSEEEQDSGDATPEPEDPGPDQQGDDVLDLYDGDMSDLEENNAPADPNQDGGIDQNDNAANREEAREINNGPQPAGTDIVTDVNTDGNNQNNGLTREIDQLQQQVAQQQLLLEQQRQQLHDHEQHGNERTNSNLERVIQDLNSVRTELRSLNNKHSVLEKQVGSNVSVGQKRNHPQQNDNGVPPKKQKQRDTHAHQSSSTNRKTKNINTKSAPSARNQNDTILNQIRSSSSSNPISQQQQPAHQQIRQQHPQPHPQHQLNFVNPANNVNVNRLSNAAGQPTASNSGMFNVFNSDPSVQNSNNPWDNFKSPFMPPAISDTQLKKIEERKYVDFNDLLPDNQTSGIDGSGNDFDNPAFDIEKPSGYLKQHDNKRFRKIKITNFQRWSTAFSIFWQAHMHFHYEDYYELFMYHAHFVTNINKYKFEACHSYDRDFRHNIANQRHMHPTQRSFHWSVPSEDLRIKHLSDNTLSKCSYCKGAGHYVSSCTIKQEHEANTLPAQLAAAITQSFPAPRQFQPSSDPAPRSNQQWRSNNFRGNNNGNSQQRQGSSSTARAASSRSIPANEKPCYRFNGGTECDQSRCPFLHRCARCPSTSHGAIDCNAQSSTNFIPLRQQGP